MRGKHHYAGGVELTRILAGQDHAPVVYFARVGDNVKIGTTENLKARLRDLYLGLEDVLVLLPGGKDVEDACHQRFAEYQTEPDGRRELFRADGALSYFLGLWRVTPAVAQQMGLPLHLMPRYEVGSVLELDGELRELEGGGAGSWDCGRAADIIGRITYLSETAEDGDSFAGCAQMCAFYWHATHENAVGEAGAVRAETLAESASLPWWVPFRSRRRRAEAEHAARLIQAHADRAADIRNLFAQALKGYERKARTR